MSNIQSLKGFQQAKTELVEASKRLEETRKSLEGKTRVLEEEARVEKLAIDRKLLLQIVQEENLTHDAAIRDLEEKIANLDLQIKPSSKVESIPSEMPSEPVQEAPEPVKKTSDDINASQEMTLGPLQESEPKESEVSPGASKKKKRGLF